MIESTDDCLDFENLDEEVEVCDSLKLQKNNPSSCASDQYSAFEPLQKDISADITCEFLEVAFHQILYSRQVYPKDIFALRKKYNVPVQMCIYPELCTYITNVIKPLKPLIAQALIRKVVLAVLYKGKCDEKFVFEINPSEIQENKRHDGGLNGLEISLRESIARILSHETCNSHRTKQRTFEVMVHIQSSVASCLLADESTLDESIRWIRDDANASLNERLIPLKTINNPPFLNMQIFVLQETQIK